MSENTPESTSDFIEALKAQGRSATEQIAEAKQQFEQCIVEASQGAGRIIKQWAKVVKNDPAKLELAYEYAEQEELLMKYSELLAEGKAHRVCFRTFIVNQYIYQQMRMAESDSAAVNDLLNELEQGDGEN